MALSELFFPTSLLTRLAQIIPLSDAQRLNDFLCKAPTEEIKIINPYNLAKIWNYDLNEIINILLNAASIGIIDFRFESSCPTCHMPHQNTQHLSYIDQKGFCNNCNITYTNTIDSNMHVYFSTNQSIRQISKSTRYDPAKAVLAIQVINNAQFRRLFGNQAPLPGKGLAINNITLLFTDLADSTATYTQRGDVSAFNLVRLHFDILFDYIPKYKGVIIKTIGDAVMATFLKPADAVNCAVALQRAFDQFNQQEDVHGDSYIKIGIHTGSCITVMLNKILDYFGTTVNIAARIQGLAGKREIIISQRVGDDLEVKNVINTQHLTLSKREVTLKGIIGTRILYEIQQI